MWTFAFDFWKSKTTHLAIVAIGTAIYTYATHKLGWNQAFLTAVLPLGIAFLRDAHVKSLNDVADLLSEIADAANKTPDTEVPADGEALGVGA